MRNRWIIAATAATLTALLPLPGAGAATDATGCSVYTYPSTSLDGFLIYGTAKEVWQDTNGLPGLQREASFCADGRVIPADTCITHSQTWVLLNCAATLASSTP